MLRWLAFLLSIALAALGGLTVFKAPNVTTWRLAILAGEYGHWFVLLSLAVAARVAIFGRNASAGVAGFEKITVVTALIATVLLGKPLWQAWRLSRQLPQTMTKAFGLAAETRPIFSWAELFRPGADHVSFETKSYAYAGRADERKLDFYRAIDAAGAAPCVIVIHGGGWDNGDRGQLPALNSHLARRGYAVAAVDYRLAPAHRWPAQADDLLAAVDYVREHARELNVDPERIVLLGRSAGGQLATAVAYGAAARVRLRGVIALYAPHDLVFAWKYSDVRDVLNSPRLMQRFLGGTPESAAETFRSASGFQVVQKGAPPTLLLHGALDSLVWHRQSERLHERLDVLGVANAFISLPWATHAFDFNFHGPGGQLSTYAIDQFLAAVMR